MCNKRGSKFGSVAGVLRSPHAPPGSGTVNVTSRSGLLAKCRLRHALRVWCLLLLLVLLSLEAMGCSSWFSWLRPVTWTELGPRNDKPKSPFRIVPRKNMSVANLSPDDIVRIMQRVGFADEQILNLGTDLHNALRISGAAEVFYRKDKLAIFVVDGDYVRIGSRSGSFDYEVSNGRFVSPLQTDR